MFVRVISVSQSSFSGSTFQIFCRMFRNCFWDWVCPCCRKIVSDVIIVVNVFHNIIAIEFEAYIGLSRNGGSCPKSPMRMIEIPPKGSYFLCGNASHKWVSISIRSFGPKKLISSIRMYLICLNSSWRFVNDWPWKGCISLIGIQRHVWIFYAWMLHVATPMGARASNDFLSLFSVMFMVFLMQSIRYDLPVPGIP